MVLLLLEDTAEERSSDNVCLNIESLPIFGLRSRCLFLLLFAVSVLALLELIELLHEDEFFVAILDLF